MEIHYLCPMFMVFDMKASLKFYVDILGFMVHQRAGEENDIGWVWLKKDDLNLMLNTQYEMPYRPPKPDASRQSTHNDTILYLGCPDVDGTYHELMKAGVKVEPPEIASYGMKQLYVNDPDGYGICFQQEV